MKEHAAVFSDFTVQHHIETGEDIVTIIITYDSKYAVCITTKGDEEYFLKSYDLAAHTPKFSVPFTGNYLKMSLIE